MTDKQFTRLLVVLVLIGAGIGAAVYFRRPSETTRPQPVPVFLPAPQTSTRPMRMDDLFPQPQPYYDYRRRR